MAVKYILNEIEEDVSDVTSTSFQYYDTDVVPNSHNSGLTFESGKVKDGRSIDTCVLFVDIRNSVALTQKHHSLTMAKIYTAFIKAVIKIGRYHKASTRNIIGDRVMLVFPSKDCFHNAVSCAISINHIAAKIIDKKFADVDFKCGIGIDYGTLKVIKVGIQRNGTEKSENKGLVWTGYPANYASRLTDAANKTFTKVIYKVNYNANKNPFLNLGYFYLTGPDFNSISGFPKDDDNPYNIIPSEEEWDEVKFSRAIKLGAAGQLEFTEGKLNSMERLETKNTYPSILFTQRVLNGLKAENSDLFKDEWKVQPGDFKDIKEKVYGASFTWAIK